MPQLLLRTPSYSFEQYRGISLKEVLTDTYFRNAIRYASEPVYQVLQKTGFDFDGLNDKMKMTLQKYYNRMCFRSTPFGSMASVSSLRFGCQDEAILLADERRVKVRPSFTNVLAAAKDILLSKADDAITYRINDSIYSTGYDIRYLRYETDKKEGKRLFFVETIESSALLDAVCAFCAAAAPQAVIASHIAGCFDATIEDSSVFVAGLIEKQLLVSSVEPHICGIDYLEHVSASMHHHAVATEDNAAGRSVYVTTYRPATGSLDKAIQQQLLNALQCTAALLPAEPPALLTAFKEAFVQKYDQQAVPLLEALDPELGVGFASLGGSAATPLLLKHTGDSTGSPPSHKLPWTAAHAYLLQQWTSSKGVIRLKQDDIARLPENGDQSLPPSTNILFRKLGEQLYIEHAGGATATALTGRFSLVHEDLCGSTKELASIEAKQNPDVIFAEISHIAELHAANIERRAQFHAYEIPVLTGSVATLDCQVVLNDLYVAVRQGTVWLWSKKLGKRIIPRLSSAYNYQRSTLAVFRFLCELQFDGLASNVNFNLSHFFPDLPFYPRVELDNCILQLATWHVSGQQVTGIQAATKEIKLANLLHLLKVELQCPRHISVNEHDHELVFDLQRQEDLVLLLDLFKNGRTVTIKEYPFVAAEPVVADNAAHGYMSQFIASIYNLETVYAGLPPELTETPLNGIQRRFMPGSEWAYFKIYCLPERANEILAQQLYPVIEALKVADVTKACFFIRYHDPAPHIRLRFLLHHKADYACVVSMLHTALQSLMATGVVIKLTADVYEREMERYSTELIEQIEQHFNTSSLLALSYLHALPAGETETSYLHLAVSSVHAMLEAFGYSLTERIAFCEQMHTFLYKEQLHPVNRAAQIKDTYRELSKVPGLFNTSAVHMPGSFIMELQDVAAAAAGWGGDKRGGLLADLIHMHLNRLFSRSQRSQEMMLYYCLWQHYTSQKARAAQQVKSLLVL